MNAYSSITRVADRLEASLDAQVIMRLPVTRQIEILLTVITGRDMFDLDGDELDRAECALSSLLSQARENAHYEDRALHGAEVAA
ncbi:MAG: hypothetical protein EOO77_19460 [Oxalobacteraceae bacterium]|nr:MAG: hypothetical protein EOO77_19460 [Oxalobacteraceae bacterium]